MCVARVLGEDASYNGEERRIKGVKGGVDMTRTLDLHVYHETRDTTYNTEKNENTLFSYISYIPNPEYYIFCLSMIQSRPLGYSLPT